jgi:hypothetical protein
MKRFLSQVLLLCLLVAPMAAQTPLSLEVVDGKTNQLILRLNAQQTSASAGGIEVRRSSTPAPETAAGSWNFAITNNSNGTRWLYLNWTTAWEFGAKGSALRYWSGKGEPLQGDALLKAPAADVSQNTTMLQAIYDDKRGLALALPPEQIVSQFEQSLQYEPKQQKLYLRLRIPLVLDAGQSDVFPIEAYRFTPRYGLLDALQLYFAAHPVAFSARTNIDPRAAGVGSHSRSWNFEEQRRLHADWNWFYAPFRRTGDIYGREKFWEFTPARPLGARTKGMTAEEYRATRHRQLEQINALGQAAAFYTPSFLYSEIQLARQEYSGAIIYNPDGSYAKFYEEPWVTGSANEVAMYPWGNKFAQQSMEDARQLVAKNTIPAFGYDVMAGGFKFRGQGLKESPRRAFDEHGEYVDSAVGIAKIADFTRGLQKDGREIALVGNTTEDSRPFLAARSDSLMFERPANYYEGQLRALRYASGHKTLTLWNAWRLNWKDKTPEELRHDYQELSDFIRLASFRYGAFPSGSWSTGAPDIRRMLPLLKEVMLQGWQPVPAVRGENGALPADLWPARYGTGTGSFITIGNNGKTAWKGSIVIDNDYVGAENYLWRNVRENATAQTVKGRTTILPVEIPPRETLVLRAIASAPATAQGDATVVWNDDGAAATLKINSAIAPTGVLPRSGWSMDHQQEKEWSFRSRYFAAPLQAIRDFPFFAAAFAAQIVLPPSATADEEWAATRLREYFQFWSEKELSRKITLPILRADEKSDPAKPIIKISRDAKRIELDGQTLTIGGENLREATLQLLSTLDEKYFYAGVLPTTGSAAAALEKAGLAGKVLPARSGEPA